MGECTGLLQQILESLESGVIVRDGEDAIHLSREDGNLKDVRDQILKMDFDETTSALTVKALLEVSEIKIGALELEDSTSGIRAKVALDDGSGALFVQSESLLGKTDFEESIGEIAEEPDEYTLSWRLLQVMESLENFTFSDDRLEVISLGELATNAVVLTDNISFLDNESGGAVGSIDDIPVEAEIKDNYLISFRNPSEETEVEIQLYLKETFYSPGTTPVPEVEWCVYGDVITIPVSPDITNPGGDESISAKSVLVEGAFLAQGLGISATLSTGTGGSGAFDLGIVIRER